MIIQCMSMVKSIAQRSDGGETRSMEEIVIDRVKETDSEFRREKKGYGQETNPCDGRRFESSRRKYVKICAKVGGACGNIHRESARRAKERKKMRRKFVGMRSQMVMGSASPGSIVYEMMPAKI